MPFGAGGFIPITFEVTGAEPIARRIQTFGQQVATLAPAWEQVGLDLLDDFAQNFAYEGDLATGGDGWEGLADSTVRDRLRQGFDGEHPILVRWGMLRDSATVRDAPGNVFEVGDNSLRVGTSWFSAKWHQFGTSRMPARPIVALTRERRAGVVDRLNAYVQRLVAEAELGG